jgi:transcriptional regulator with XRE-family HTH domain
MRIEQFINCSYKELSELTGVSKETWSYWFNGKRTISVRNLKRVAEKLEMPISEVLEGLETRKKVSEKSLQPVDDKYNLG